MDIDTEEEYDVARLRFSEWRKHQLVSAEELYGPPPTIQVRGEK